MGFLRKFSRSGKVAAVAVLCLCLFACGPNRITKENYEKINNGMTESEVLDLLGSPTQTLDASALGGQNFGFDAKHLIWRNGDNVITVAFMGGKVVMKLGFFEGNVPGFGGSPKGGNKDGLPFPWAPQPNPGQDKKPDAGGQPPDILNPLPGGNNQPAGNGSDKISKANLDKVMNGMTEAEVTAILGPTSNSFMLGADVKVLQWNGANNLPLITIHLRNGKVVLKAPGFGLK
jgi:hypothetical protein